MTEPVDHHGMQQLKELCGKSLVSMTKEGMSSRRMRTARWSFPPAASSGKKSWMRQGNRQQQMLVRMEGESTLICCQWNVN
jgi:hypothetical protein